MTIFAVILVFAPAPLRWLYVCPNAPWSVMWGSCGGTDASSSGAHPKTAAISAGKVHKRHKKAQIRQKETFQPHRGAF